MSQVYLIEKVEGITRVKSWDIKYPSKVEHFVYGKGADYRIDKNNYNITIDPGTKSRNPILHVTYDQLDETYGQPDLPSFFDYLIEEGFFTSPSEPPTHTYEDLGTQYWYGVIANPELTYPSAVGSPLETSIGRFRRETTTDSVYFWFDSNGEISLDSPVGINTLGDTPNYLTIGDYISFFSPTTITVRILQNHYSAVQGVMGDRINESGGNDSFVLWTQAGGFETDPNTGKVAIQCLAVSGQMLKGAAIPLLDSGNDASVSFIGSNVLDNLGVVFGTREDNDQPNGLFGFFDARTGSANVTGQLLPDDATGAINAATNEADDTLLKRCVVSVEGGVGITAYNLGGNSLGQVSTTGKNYTNDSFYVGSRYGANAGNNLFEGYLSLVRVHGKALTDEEALELDTLDQQLLALPTYENLGTKFWYGVIANPELEYPTEVGTSSLFSIGFIRNAGNPSQGATLYFDDNREISLNSPVRPGTGAIDGTTLQDWITANSVTEITISQLTNHYNRTDASDALTQPSAGILTFRLWTQGGGFETDPNTGKVAINCLGLAGQLMEGPPIPLLDSAGQYSISGIFTNNVDINTGTVITQSDAASPDNDRVELRINTQAAGVFWFYFDGVVPSSTVNFNDKKDDGDLVRVVATYDWDAKEINGFSDGVQQVGPISIAGTAGYVNRTFRIATNRVNSVLYNGYISLVRVHDKALTGDEAGQLDQLDQGILS